MHKIEQREQQLHSWLSDLLGNGFRMHPITGDASFRRYYRVQCPDRTLIAMDAPPEHEDAHRFVTIANSLLQHNIPVPTIIDTHIEKGFALLSDFGDKQLLSLLSNDSVDAYYDEAMKLLYKLQQCTQLNNYTLPIYDETYLTKELNLFSEFYLKVHLNLEITHDIQVLLNETHKKIIDNLVSQPQVAMHLDYQSRNLMVLEHNQLGLIDFQDIMLGPITYDLASLLRDCYIDWPDEKVIAWLNDFYHMLSQHNAALGFSSSDFYEWFQWSTMQRHLKNLGTFSRLHHRDSRSNYLDDIPRTFNYVLRASSELAPLTQFHEFLTSIQNEDLTSRKETQ